MEKLGNVAKIGEKWLGVAIYMWEIVGKVRKKVGIVAKSWEKVAKSG